jgi:hypothetical protein
MQHPNAAAPACIAMTMLEAKETEETRFHHRLATLRKEHEQAQDRLESRLDTLQSRRQAREEHERGDPHSAIKHRAIQPQRFQAIGNRLPSDISTRLRQASTHATSLGLDGDDGRANGPTALGIDGPSFAPVPMNAESTIQARPAETREPSPAVGHRDSERVESPAA